MSSGSWDLRPEYNCFTAAVVAAIAAADVAIDCCSCCRIVVGRVDGDNQNQIAVAVVVAAVAVHLGIQVVAPKGLVVDTGTPSDCHVVAVGCRETGVVAC